MKIFIELRGSDLNPGRSFWGKPKAGKYKGVYQLSIYREDGTAKVIDTSQIYKVNKKDRVLISDSVDSLIIKQSPPEEANTMATKKAAAKKTATKKSAAKKSTVKKGEGGPGKIEQIIALHKSGLSNQEIVEKGFNKTTVSIQVAKFKKAKLDKKASKA